MDWQTRITEFERLNPNDVSGVPRLYNAPAAPEPEGVSPAKATAWTVVITVALFFLWPLLFVPHIFAVAGLIAVAAILMF